MVSNGVDWQDIVSDAALSGDLTKVREILESGFDINTVFDYRHDNRLLHFAVIGGHLETVKFLVENGAEIDVENSNKDTPVELSAEYNYPEILKYLVNSGAEVKKRPNALIYSASSGQLNGVRFLLGFGVPVTTKERYGSTGFGMATRNHHFDVASVFIESGFNLEKEDEKEKFALSACEEGNLDELDFIEKHGANLHQINDEGKTCLHAASVYGHKKVVHYLLDKHVDINAINNSGDTALHSAAEWGYLSIVLDLLDKQADVFIENNEGLLPIHVAKKEIIRKRIKKVMTANHRKSTPIVQKKINTHITPLCRAALYGEMKLVKRLMEEEQNNQIGQKKGLTALHYAVFGGQVNIAKYLIEKSFDPLTSSEQTSTPFNLAVKLDQVKILKIFLGKTEEKFKRKHDTLINACFEGSVNIVKYLLSLELNPNFRESDENYTALMMAARGCHLTVEKLLCDHGAEINSSTSGGDTALLLASDESHLPSIRYLIRRGANPSVCDEVDKNTPLSLALEESRFDIAEYLIKKGAKVNSEDQYYDTPLHYAAKNGSPRLVSLLINQGARLDVKNSQGLIPKYEARNNQTRRAFNNSNKNREMNQ